MVGARAGEKVFLRRSEGAVADEIRMCVSMYDTQPEVRKRSAVYGTAL